MVIVLGTLVAVAVIAAIVYLFVTRPAGRNLDVGTSSTTGGSSSSGGGDIGTKILGGALAGVGTALSG